MISIGHDTWATHSIALKREIDKFVELSKDFSAIRHKAPKNDGLMARRLGEMNLEFRRLIKEYLNGENAVSAFIWRYRLQDGTHINELAAGQLGLGDRVTLLVRGAAGEYAVVGHEVDRDTMRGWNIIELRPRISVGPGPTVAGLPSAA